MDVVNTRLRATIALVAATFALSAGLAVAPAPADAYVWVDGCRDVTRAGTRVVVDAPYGTAVSDGAARGAPSPSGRRLGFGRARSHQWRGETCAFSPSRGT